MRVAVFSTKSYDRDFLEAANNTANSPFELDFHEAHLTSSTAKLAEGSDAVCAFVNDHVDAKTLEILAKHRVRLVALRCAGFNNVDLEKALELGIAVARVPAYSPEAVAEYTVALILTLNRKTHRAYARVREGNFALEGLLGFNLSGRTLGIVGVGKIGLALARIMSGFGCRILATDPARRSDFEATGGRYVDLTELLAASDIISLHCPLTPATRHLINADVVRMMKPGAMLINTSRGAVVDTLAVIDGLKSGKIGYFGIDVYEEEDALFFEDLSEQVIQDDVFARLLTFPNVLVTGHQAFFTAEALTSIAQTTIANLTSFAATGKPLHQVSTERLKPRDVTQ
jgi:D-lactate dehydrogenase